MDKWENHLKKIKKLEEILKKNPSNLKYAMELWFALGNGEHNIQDGVRLVKIFREAAISSKEGLEAFAQAYKDLYSLTGERPRIELIDEEFRNAIFEAKASIQNETVDWILDMLNRSINER
jgi:hypothetical protein